MEIARIKESFTVLCLVTLLLFSPVISTIAFFFAWRLTWPLALIYAGWMFLDRHTDVRGGRWSDRVRRWSLWSVFTRYFPMELVKTVNLDPTKNYIFGYHPHGRFSLGAVGQFATEATGFSRLFPGLRSHLMLLRLQFLFPFSRDLFLHLGACRVSRESCEYLLQGRPGQALVIVLGGIKEMKLAKENTMILYLRERQGFVRLALRHGASLVPVISFGENELYRQSMLSYLPRRHRVTTVGAPIVVQATLDPSSEQIARLHQEYLQSVEQLFETQKGNYGLGHVSLQLI